MRDKEFDERFIVVAKVKGIDGGWWELRDRVDGFR